MAESYCPTIIRMSTNVYKYLEKHRSFVELDGDTGVACTVLYLTKVTTSYLGTIGNLPQQLL